MTSRGLRSRTALTSTSYYNSITTDYQSVSPKLFQDYCSAKQSTLLGKQDLWFLLLDTLNCILPNWNTYFFSCASIFYQFPQHCQAQLFSSRSLLKRQRLSVTFVLSFISVRIQVNSKQASLHKFKSISLTSCLFVLPGFSN